MPNDLFRGQFDKAPHAWQLVPLKMLMNVESGKEAIVEVHEGENAVPVYGSGLLPFKFTDRSISSRRAIVFGRKGTIGQPYLVSPPYWLVDTAYSATPKNGVVLQYLYFLLSVFDWQPFVTNTAKPSLVANDILAEKVPCPSVIEQEKIVEFLESKTAEIDALIEKLSFQVELLERYRQELIAHTVTRGLNPDVLMRDSGIEWIGEVPTTWRLLKISALYDLRSQKVSDKDYPPLSITMNGVVPQLETVAKTNDGDSRKLVRTGDFVINSRSDRRGACGIALQDGSCSLINIVLTPRESVHNRYFSYLFRSILFADEFYRWGHGIHDDLWTTNWEDMKSIQVPVPPLEDQEAMANYLDNKMAEINSIVAGINKQIELFRRHRKQVIDSLVTGKVRVGGVA